MHNDVLPLHDCDLFLPDPTAHSSKTKPHSTFVETKTKPFNVELQSRQKGIVRVNTRTLHIKEMTKLLSSSCSSLLSMKLLVNVSWERKTSRWPTSWKDDWHLKCTAQLLPGSCSESHLHSVMNHSNRARCHCQQVSRTHTNTHTHTGAHKKLEQMLTLLQ